MTLTEFLLARIAEDEERHARDLVGRDYGYGHARVLAECEAKRRIVELHQVDGAVRLRSTDEKVYVCRTCQLDEEPPPGPMEWPCDTIRIIAAVYSDHPDYRDEWRP